MEVLNQKAIKAAIDDACAFTVQQDFQNGKTCAMAKELSLHRALPSDDLPSLLQYLSRDVATEPRHPEDKTTTSTWNTDACRLDVPNMFGLVLRNNKEASIVGFVSFYLAYSTWDGRVLYLDKLLLPRILKDSSLMSQPDRNSVEWSLHYTLSDIALRLGCARYTWQHVAPCPTYPGDIQPETLDGWLTLHRQHETNQLNHATKWTADSDRKAIDDALERSQKQEKNKSNDIRLRLATIDDLETIERLVMGLAVFEKEPESVHVFKEHYRRDGFNKDQLPLFRCLLLEHHPVDSDNVYVFGMAFCWFGYAFGEGRFLYLEDLFIEKEFRGTGGGSLVMQLLTEIAKSTHCVRGVWQALDWNTPALNFYNKIGARVIDGLLTTRFAADDLIKFHTNRSSN